MRIARSKMIRRLGVLSMVFALFLMSSCEDAHDAYLYQPRFVLNRSLFLSWQEYWAGDFESYEIHGSTSTGFKPGAGTLIYSTADKSRVYADIRGLAPDTAYYFKLRIVTKSMGGARDSGEVSAHTASDGGSGERIRIVIYHNVQPREQFPQDFDDGGWVSTAQLDEQLRYLKSRNAHCITHREYLDWRFGGIPLPQNPVMLTFDDGYENFLEHAVPILLANDCIATCFIVTGMAGSFSYWAGPEWPVMPLMTWDEIKQCRREGFWIGAHSQTHVDIRNPSVTEPEILGSRDDIVNQLGEHPVIFSYPYGHGFQSEEVHEVLADAGFQAAVAAYGLAEEPVRWSDDPFMLPRIYVFASDSVDDFASRLQLGSD